MSYWDWVAVLVAAIITSGAVGFMLAAVLAAGRRRTPSPVAEIATEVATLEARIARQSAGRVLLAMHSGLDPEPDDLVNLTGAVLGVWPPEDEGLVRVHAVPPHPPESGMAEALPSELHRVTDVRRYWPDDVTA